MSTPYYLPSGLVYGFFVDGKIVTINPECVISINAVSASQPNMSGLPTSTAGLNPGDLWNNAGFLCIV